MIKINLANKYSGSSETKRYTWNNSILIEYKVYFDYFLGCLEVESHFRNGTSIERFYFSGFNEIILTDNFFDVISMMSPENYQFGKVKTKIITTDGDLTEFAVEVVEDDKN